MLNVLAARPRAGASLENELARQLARMANGEAVLQAMATEYQVRIRYRMPHTPRKGKEEAELHAQLLAAAAQFFERVENRRAALASARDSPATSKVL